MPERAEIDEAPLVGAGAFAPVCVETTPVLMPELIGEVTPPEAAGGVKGTV